MFLRGIARLFNYALSFIIFFIFSYPFVGQYNALFYLVSLPIIFLTILPLEALSLSKWATTPGHALFGMSIKELSYKEAFKYLLLRRPQTEVVQTSIPSLHKMLGLSFVGASALILLFATIGTPWGSSSSNRVTIDEWDNYYCSDKGFSIDFPTSPLFAEKQMSIAKEDKTLKYIEYSSSANGAVHYSVSYVDFPSSWKLVGCKVLLKEFFNVILENVPGCELVAKNYSDHGEYRCLDYHLTQDGQEIVGRLIVVKNTLYRLTVSFPSNEVAQLDEGLFLNSFTVE